MMDVMRFIFSDFWIWLGFIIFVGILLGFWVGALKSIKALRNKRNIYIYNFEDQKVIEIENASISDITDIVGLSASDDDQK